MTVSQPHNKAGANIRDLKQQNRALILKHIALTRGLSRGKLARIVGLSKMAVGNLVSDLIAMGLVEECETPAANGNYGRRPIILQLAAASPCICGMLVKRGFFQVILADLGGAVLHRRDIPFEGGMDQEQMLALLLGAYDALRREEPRRVLAVGIASVGPVDAASGVLLTPPSFYSIRNVPLAQRVQEHTGLPAFLIHDASAGALAEKFYGGQKNTDNFIYLHIMNGIGGGYVLDGRLYDGDSGQSGEIGHTSINFMGPRCSCGNVGCLELYANVPQMRRRITELLPLYRSSAMPALGGSDQLTWLDIVDAANHKEAAAVAALEEFCGYLAYAVAANINLLDLSCIVVGYESSSRGGIVEKLLQSKIAACSRHKNITVLHSGFGGDAPLIGSIACVAQRVFDLSRPLLLDEPAQKEGQADHAQ